MRVASVVVLATRACLIKEAKTRRSGDDSRPQNLRHIVQVAHCQPYVLIHRRNFCCGTSVEAIHVFLLPF